MIDAAVKALQQMFSPRFRAVLIKSVALALVLIVLIGIGIHRILVWLAANGGMLAEGALGSGVHGPLSVLLGLLSIIAGLGIILGAVFLMPAVTAFVASFFVDEIAEEVERTHYPNDPPGKALPFGRALIEGTKTGLLALVVYLLALPFIFIAGLGLFILFFANAYLLSREYFELAAMRFRPPAEAKAMRRDNAATIFTAGLIIAAFVSIPVVNLATPLFGMALMVHLHKRLSGPRPELIEPSTANKRA
jgi:CysZ protein